MHFQQIGNSFRVWPGIVMQRNHRQTRACRAKYCCFIGWMSAAEVGSGVPPRIDESNDGELAQRDGTQSIYADKYVALHLSPFNLLNRVVFDKQKSESGRNCEIFYVDSIEWCTFT